jgi:hypothetical protein
VILISIPAAAHGPAHVFLLRKPAGIGLACIPEREVCPMLWILAAVMGGVGFAWMTTRRKRKAAQKTAT